MAEVTSQCDPPHGRPPDPAVSRGELVAVATSRIGRACCPDEPPRKRKAMSRFKNAKHLFGLAGLFAIGLLAMLVARAVFVPKSFGKYGHYRGDAITEIAAMPVATQASVKATTRMEQQSRVSQTG